MDDALKNSQTLWRRLQVMMVRQVGYLFVGNDLIYDIENFWHLILKI